MASADDPARGPRLSLEGPASPALDLEGRVQVIPLRADCVGVVHLGSDGVDVRATGLFMQRFRTTLALRGSSLDDPRTLTFRAELQGDLFQELVARMKEGFDAIMADARATLADARRIFDQEWARFTRLVEEGYNAVRAGILQSKHEIETIIQKVNEQLDA